jgi:hypothetical protein
MRTTESRIELAAIWRIIQNIMAREYNSCRALSWSEASICVIFDAVYIRLSIDYFHSLTKHFPDSRRAISMIFQHAEGGSDGYIMGSPDADGVDSKSQWFLLLNRQSGYQSITAQAKHD